MDLLQYGFNQFFEALAKEYPELEPARIISQEKGIYRLRYDSGESFAVISGKLRFDAVTASDYPAVGDFVMADHLYDDGNAVIHHILPRRSVFIRKAAGTGRQEQVVAANIDTVFLCMALNNDFNLRRLERYLAIAWDSGAKPVVVLTKADLCSELEEKKSSVEAIAIGADVVATSALEENGINAIIPYLKPNTTVSLIGSSGVGKSSLINKLLGEPLIATNGLRNDDKGRHTTTHRELFRLPNGALVIDTPGMRELGMWNAESGIDTVFADIEALSAQCRFPNCSHTAEPGCAIQIALDSGALARERWRSYRKLCAETAYAEDSQSFLAAKEKKFKQISKYNKSNRKKF